MKKFILLSVLLIALCSVGYTQCFPSITSPCDIFSPIKTPRGQSLPGWLTSEYAPIFNGVNQYAKTGTGYGRNISDFTIMFWAKPNVVNLSQYLMDWFETSTQRIQIYDIGSANRYVIRIGGAGDLFTSPASTITLAQWQHLAWTKSGSSLILYKNASLVASWTRATTTLAIGATGTPYLGSTNVPGAFWAGSLAEVNIFDRALDQSEILKYKDKRLKGTEAGLVAYYPLNEPPGSTVFVDKVGGKNAVGSNSIQITRRNGYSAPDVRSERYCLSFDGVDDYASGTNTGISTYPFTMETWTFVPVTGTYRSAIDITTTATSTAYYFATFSNTSLGVTRTYAFRCNIFDTSGRLEYTGGGLARWRHIAIVAAAHNNFKLFINGAEVASSATSVPFPPVPLETIRVGRFLTSYSPGKHVEVRIWNTARTPAEIQANMYTQLTGSETGLVYYYRGNEGTGTTLTNLGSAGSAGNLTLYNSQTWVGRDIP